jgi:glycogen debranching enzyme
MIDFGRDLCADLCFSAEREWLVTNGIGGYAMGNIAGLRTRRYHGLLVAALKPPVGRTLLVAKLDDTVAYDGHDYPLFANDWIRGAVEPHGFRYLERFHLEGTTPVWTYACADALLEKGIWMQQGANTTYVRYHLRRATSPLVLAVKVLVTHRDHHANTRAADWTLTVERVARGLCVTAFEGATPVYLLSDRAEATPRHEWYEGRYGGDLQQRDAAYHQGTVWGWLVGPFVSAHLRVYGDCRLARSFLQPLLRHLTGHGVGSLSEIFDGDPPFTPRGCIAQAWTVAEVLRACQATAGI